MNKYLIAFSSFYKAIYAQDKLREQRISATLGKTPPGLLRSCGYGLYLQRNSLGDITTVLQKSSIVHSGIFAVEEKDGVTNYRRIS